jgi:cellulose biosynthesis protein BcsQ
MPANIGGPASSGSSRSTRTSRRGHGGRPVPLIAVIGGCGGAGASTLAASLAVTALGVGRRAILFDADPLGGGLESLVALGTVAVAASERFRAARAWPHGVAPPEPDPEQNREAQPRRKRPLGRGRIEPDLALVTWGGSVDDRIPVAAMRNALRVLRTSADVVVVDLPRIVDDSTQLVLSEATHTLVIAPVSERTAVSTSRLLPRLSVVGPRPQLVARLPSRDELTAREFATLLDAPLAGIVRPGRNAVPRRTSFEQLGGRSATSLARFSRRIIERCVIAPAEAAAGVERTQVTR